jgi:hypothetical protein
VYRQQEAVEPFAPDLFGLAPEALERLGDDRIGRALDHLFNADRSALLTDVILATVKHFDLQLDRLHNDSTSVYLSAVSIGVPHGPPMAAPPQ